MSQDNSVVTWLNFALQQMAAESYATLLFDRETDSYTLSFRSTEPRLALEGGDVERDGLFASGLPASSLEQKQLHFDLSLELSGGH
jgi:hypothetical protein